MKKQLLMGMVAGTMLFGMLPMTAMAAPEAVEVAATEVHEHDSVTFKPLPANLGGGTLNAGNYYLTGDYDLKDRGFKTSGNVSICLNGYNITGAPKMARESGVIDTGIGSTFDLYDCTGKGTILATKKAVIRNNGTVNVHGGNLKATGSAYTIRSNEGTKLITNIYGGNLSAEGLVIESKANRGDGELNIYGGTLTSTGNSYGYPVLISYNKAAISGGTFTGTQAALCVNMGADVIISGGTFNGGDTAIKTVTNATGPVHLTLSGAPVLNGANTDLTVDGASTVEAVEYSGQSVRVNSYDADSLNIGDIVIMNNTTDKFSIVDECRILVQDGANLILDEAHNYEWLETKAPTCTEDGEKVGTCTVCGETTEPEVIPAKGHTEVIDEAVPADCENTGLTEGSHCSECGEVLVAQEVTEALGHDYSIWNYGKNNHWNVCSRCDAADNDSVAAHNFKKGSCVDCGYGHGFVEDPEEELVNKTALKELVDYVNALQHEDYTCKSWAKIQKDLEEAEQVLADEKASQKDVDKACRKLGNAVEKLEPVEVEDTEEIFTDDVFTDSIE